MLRSAPLPPTSTSVSPSSTALESLEAQLEHERRISSALSDVGNALGTTLDLDELLELILDRLTDLLEADRSTLYILDEHQGDLVSRFMVGQQVRSIRVKVGHGVAGTVAKNGRPIRIKDAYADARFEPEWDMLTGYRTGSMLAVPLKNHGGRTIGVIQVLNKSSAEEFSAEDEAILSALSTQAAVAIDNSRLFLSLTQKNKLLLDATDELGRRVKDLELLFDLERATGRATSNEELARAALEATCEACEAQGAALLLAEEESGDLVHYGFDGSRPDLPLCSSVKASEGFCALSMSKNQIVEVTSGADHKAYSDKAEGEFSFAITSVIAIPLEGEDAPIGAMALFSKRGGRSFGTEDISLLRLVSANVSTAVRLFRASEARERGARLTTIGSLLSQVIHDFKTPMTVISGYVQVMQEADDGESRKQYAAKILKQFQVLTNMQREVLEFARGERNVFVRRVYMRAFFHEIEEQLGHEIQIRASDAHPIRLTVDIDRKMVVHIDEARVSRAIHNLARNAIEAMLSTGGELRLSAALEDSELVVTVADSGPGIPKGIESKLFQSFVTANKQSGTGLGLAIVKKIVEEHGGSVQVSSSGFGATFSLRMPQPKQPNTQPPGQLSSRDTAGPSPADELRGLKGRKLGKPIPPAPARATAAQSTAKGTSLKASGANTAAGAKRTTAEASKSARKPAKATTGKTGAAKPHSHVRGAKATGAEANSRTAKSRVKSKARPKTRAKSQAARTRTQTKEAKKPASSAKATKSKATKSKATKSKATTKRKPQ